MTARRKFINAIAGCLLWVGVAANAQPAKIYRVGVVLPGGPFYQVVEGLRDGLKELGFVEGNAVRLAHP